MNEGCRILFVAKKTNKISFNFLGNVFMFQIYCIVANKQ